MAAAISTEVTKRMPIDFSSVESLPDSHTWCSDECSDVIARSVPIPVVDLMDPNAMEAIRLACEEWGVFQLKNHGIPLSLLTEGDEEIKRLFSLPAEQKAKAVRSPGGITGYGPAFISPFFHKSMWHEGFTIASSSYDDIKKIWPHGHARFCEIMDEIQKQMKILADDLTDQILKLLGICEEEKLIGSSKSTHVIQLNSYPTCPNPDRAMGFAPHKDTSIITFLHQAQVRTQNQINGLQVFKEGTGWVPVHPDPDALVVLVGDLLHIISNARFSSVLHRVTVNKTSQRYSFAYFHKPPPDYLLSPFGSVPRFRTITMKEYVALKVKDPRNAFSFISI